MKTPDKALPDGVAWQVDNDAGRLAESLADETARCLGQALEERGRASLAVSGGSTPVPFFQALSQKTLDWSRVDILLADERWVDETDAASNTRLVREHLLQGPAAAARYTALKPVVAADSETEGTISAQELAAVEQALDQVSWPLDVLILGMGTDGHTASLFPDAPELAAALGNYPGSDLGADRKAGMQARVAAMHPASQPQARITLTLPVLAAARHTALHLKGEAKLSTLLEAMKAPENVTQMPVRAFLKPGVTVFWSP